MKEKKDIWIANSGSNGHIMNNMKWFIDFKEFPTPKKISGHSSKPTLALGTGIVLLPALNPAGMCRMKIQDVWFAPTVPYSLLSLNRLEELGAAYDWRISLLIYMKTEKIIASIEPWNGIKVVKLNLEEVAKLKDKNDTLTEPSEPPEPPADEPDAPDESDAPKEPTPNDPDNPDVPDDPEIDDEHPLPQTECHLARTAAEERPEDRKLAGYTALREEDTLR